MHWQGQFRASFFGAWTDAGLPDPEPYLESFRAATLRVASAPPLPPEREGSSAPAEGDPLDPELIQRVYRFGEVLGAVLARLSGADPERAADCTGWCGRFNVGISLFDYVCDVAGRGDALARVEPFNQFEAQSGRSSDAGAATTTALPSLEPVEIYLAGLASDLIDELGAAAAGRLDWQPMLARLYRAERDLATWPLTAGTDLKAVREMLQAASAEPFAVMAAWASLADPDADTEAAVRIGHALGRCFWVVDDACDLWIDLDARAWNLFIVRAAALEPRLITEPDTTLRDIHLSRHLVASGVAHEESRSAVKALTEALDTASADADDRRAALALAAAALAMWF